MVSYLAETFAFSAQTFRVVFKCLVGDRPVTLSKYLVVGRVRAKWERRRGREEGSGNVGWTPLPAPIITITRKSAVQGTADMGLPVAGICTFWSSVEVNGTISDQQTDRTTDG